MLNKKVTSSFIKTQTIKQENTIILRSHSGQMCSIFYNDYLGKIVIQLNNKTQDMYKSGRAALKLVTALSKQSGGFTKLETL